MNPRVPLRAEEITNARECESKAGEQPMTMGCDADLALDRLLTIRLWLIHARPGAIHFITLPRG
jgi:hypothetical protein